MASDPDCVLSDTVSEEAWDDLVCGRVSWQTLISKHRTNSTDLCCGKARFPAYGILCMHSHSPAERIHVLSGHGQGIVDGATIALQPGDTVFVPGGALYEWRAGPEGLGLFYAYAAGAFSDIDYQFTDGAGVAPARET